MFTRRDARLPRLEIPLLFERAGMLLLQRRKGRLQRFCARGCSCQLLQQPRPLFVARAPLGLNFLAQRVADGFCRSELRGQRLVGRRQGRKALRIL